MTEKGLVMKAILGPNVLFLTEEAYSHNGLQTGKLAALAAHEILAQKTFFFFLAIQAGHR